MIDQIKKFGVIILIASIGGLSGAYVYNKILNTAPVYTLAPEKVPVRFTNGALPSSAVDFTEAADRTVHGVVHIKKFFTATQVGYNNPFDMFFGGARSYNVPQASTGSGVVISNDGYIVTNNHVVDNADKVEVTLSNNKRYEGKVIGTDPSTDLALIKIDAANLPFIPIGNSDDVRVGQWVLAVGNPFNLTSTVTAGIISAKGRNINILESNNGQATPIESFIQTDAAVNPGNSGGALVNTGGELIGINSAIASNTGSYSGYSFAVPSNIVRKVVDDFMEFGTVQRAYIGIQGRPIDADLAKEKNLKESQGVYVDRVTTDGAAKEAGLKDGDVITKIDGVKINDWPDLLEQVGRHRPGDKIEVAYMRDEKEFESAIILKNKSGNTSVVKNEVIKVLGAEISPLDNNDKSSLGIENGAKVTNLGNGILKSSGVRQGFIITSIDKQPITNTSDVESLLNENKEGGVLVEGVYSNGMRAWYGVGLEKK